MPYSLGTPTVNKGFLKSESHKLHQAFVVAAGQTIYEGQAVKLNATGEVVAAASGEVRTAVIGFAVFGAAATETVTVVMKAHSIIFAQASQAFDPTDIVKYDGFDTGTGYNKVTDNLADATNYIGKPLQAATAPGDIVEVALY